MRSLYLFTIVLLVLGGCLKKNQLPDQPIINSHRFESNADSAVIYLDFTDGNGDFGLNPEDTTGVFSDCLRRYNLYAEYYELQEGEWVWEEIDPCDGGPGDGDVPFYFKIPWAKPTGQNQTQEGEIKLALNDWYLPSDYDTIKFVIKIVDRSMNESNEVEVGPYVKIY